MKYKAIIFDLDGTLTYTLEDLKNSVNHALRAMQWPERSLEEVRMFVGNGVRKLIERSAPSDISAEDFEECFAEFKKHYIVHCQDNTRLYEGVTELLCELKTRGHLMAIVSNKLQAGVDELFKEYFAGTIDTAIGERTGIPCKPQPEMVENAIGELSKISLERHGTALQKSDCVYIGDSDVDIQTARNAGLECISVLWGFRDKDFLTSHGATTFATIPSDILALV